MYLSLLVITYKHGQRFKAYTGTTFCIILLTPFLNIKGNKTMLCHQFLWKTIYLHNCPWNGKLKKSWWHLLMNVLELGQGKSYKITVFVMNYLKSSWFRLGIGYSIPGHSIWKRMPWGEAEMHSFSYTNDQVLYNQFSPYFVECHDYQLLLI